MELDVEPGATHVGHEVVHAAQRRQRTAGPLPVVAQEPEQAAHIGDRVATAALDGQQHLALGDLLGPQHTPHRSGLHSHHADAVADHVVQLACDASPLLGQGHATLRLEAIGLEAHDAHGPADRDSDNQPGERDPDVAGVALADDRGDRVEPRRGDARRDHLAPGRERAERVQRDHVGRPLYAARSTDKMSRGADVRPPARP